MLQTGRAINSPTTDNKFYSVLHLCAGHQPYTLYNIAMRTTDNKKDSILRIRLPENLRDYIYKKSKRRGITVSQYVRDVLTREMYR